MPVVEPVTQSQQQTALALQRSLVPTTLAIEGLDIAARYRPAGGDLGGDWYDVFSLPGERIGVVMGDVVGHDLAAAIVMGRLRSALRAYALEHASPAVVLDLLDRKIFHFERGALATVLYGVSQFPFDEITFSCAGHPAPMVVALGGAAHQLELRHDLMLGVRPGAPRHEQSVALHPGASVCMFTDGLVERRYPADWDTDQLAEGLATLAVAFTPAGAEDACEKVMRDVVDTQRADDDVAVMIVRRPG